VGAAATRIAIGKLELIGLLPARKSWRSTRSKLAEIDKASKGADGVRKLRWLELYSQRAAHQLKLESK
jgi:hypothetical protein